MCVVIRPVRPAGIQRIALHEKSVGVRPRRYSKRSVSVNIILDIAAQRRVSATAKSDVSCVQTADWQFDVLIGECRGGGVEHLFPKIDHIWLDPSIGPLEFRLDI